ncbi:MAG TPA: TrkA family potassium uptake protein [Candidatus Limnocylindria bacterium]|nr:TrkA family potassium uptake protein [Candidatus Limnocylindria bacterium]
MNVIVVGCGRVGGFLAGLLDKGGHAVTVVDKDRGAFVHLIGATNVTTLLGDGTDMESLRRAGIERADAFLALTEGDNRNLMSAQIAKEIFGVKRVIAKVNDPIRAELYRGRGIQTFSRTTILGTLLEALLRGDTEVGEVLLQRSLAHERELSAQAEGVKASR